MKTVITYLTFCLFAIIVSCQFTVAQITAIDDVSYVLQNNQLLIAPIANDTVFGILGGSGASIVSISTPSNGNANIVGINNDSISYFPSAGFIGKDTITYQICNSANTICSYGNVHLNVISCIDLLNDTICINGTLPFTSATPFNVKVNPLQNDVLPMTKLNYSYSHINGTGIITGFSPDSSHIVVNVNVPSIINTNPIDSITYFVCDVFGLCCDTAKVYIIVDSTCNFVYPGDANDDGLANNLDVLNLGLGFSFTGTERGSFSNLYLPYTAQNWPTSSPGGNVNFKFADCNGDGEVNYADTTAISLNYNKTHMKGSGSAGAVDDPPFVISLPIDTSLAGNMVSTPIVLGSATKPINNIYGIAFTINYDPTLIDTGSITFDFSNSWIGNSSNTISYVKTFPNNGVIDVTHVRTDQTTISGWGPICTMDFVIEQELVGKTTALYKPLPLHIGNVKAIDNQENEIALNVLSTTLIINSIKSVNDIQSIVSIYPNPASNELKIELAENEIDLVYLTDINGKQLWKENSPTSTTKLNTSQFANGIYFLSFEADGFTYSTKVIIQH